MENPIIISYTPISSAGGINKAYENAIMESGGILKTIDKKEDIDILIDKIDGVLLPGGADINPVLYDQEQKGYCQKPNEERDAFEIHLIDKALERNLPILGICRGVQILNVKFGGSLYQDLEKEKEGSAKHDWHGDGPRSLLAHHVSIKEGTYLHNILGIKDLEVNSLHHQGIKDLGRDLVASAITPDGLIEAIELPNYPYLVAVQWHPEELTSNPAWKRFFDDFVGACKKNLS